jgi:hypothetical protein
MLSVQIHNHPPFIALLDVGNGKLCDLGAAKTATGEHRHNRAVPACLLGLPDQASVETV